MRLAIDTATDIASVAVGEPGGKVKAARSMRGARQHAAQLLPMIQQVLAEGRTVLRDITQIVVGDGPGSFTGLRIGWAAARGLSHQRDIRVVAVSSLLGAAHAAARGDRGPVAACYDALRGQIFAAIYEFVPGRVVPLVGPDVFTVAELAKASPVVPGSAVGDGAESYRAEIETWIGKPLIRLDTVPPVAASLVALADFKGPVRPLDDPLAEPVYGRPAEAQVKWEARHGRALSNPPR